MSKPKRIIITVTADQWEVLKRAARDMRKSNPGTTWTARDAAQSAYQTGVEEFEMREIEAEAMR